MFLHVTSVTYLDSYRLRLAFNNGAVKDVDLRDELYGQVFEPLKDGALFKQAAVNSDTNTVEWPNGADFAPEFLYEIGKEVEAEEKLREVTQVSVFQPAGLPAT